MSESVEFSVTDHNCALLNTSQELLVQLADDIGHSQSDLRVYQSYFKNFSGLQEQIAFNIEELKDKYRGYGKEGEVATAAFVSGELMTFELIRRTAMETKQSVPDPPFYSGLPRDEDRNKEMPEDIWVVDLCDREELLPDYYPNFFEASLVMAGKITDEDPQQLRRILYTLAIPTAVSRQAFYLVNFLSGATEVLNHLERHAWVEDMESREELGNLKKLGSWMRAIEET